MAESNTCRKEEGMNEAEELTSVEERKKWVGSMIWVWWDAEKKFYEASIESYNPDTDRHMLLYVIDGFTFPETLNLNEQRWYFVNASSFSSSSEMMPPLKKKIKGNYVLDSGSSKPPQPTKANNTSANADAERRKKGSKSKETPSKASNAIETESSSSSSEGTQTPPPEEVVMRYVNVAKNLNLRVDSFENINDVKDKFIEFKRIETNLQRVFFTKGGFENDQELDFERKDDGSNVHLNLHYGVRLQINIKVSWTTTTDDDKLISLDVYSWDTIGDVKTKFQHKEGTPANQLTLFCDRKQLDDDLQTLAGYDIENDSILYAVLIGEDKIKITVRPPRSWDPIEVMVKLCSTVENLKRMIHCMGLFAVDRQKLLFNGVLLENNQRLADYKIQMGSLLDLDFIRRTNGMKIFLKTLTGRRIPIYVDSSDTIDTLITEFRYRDGYPEEQLRLTFGKVHMQNGRTLGDYNIQEESTVHLFLRHC